MIMVNENQYQKLLTKSFFGFKINANENQYQNQRERLEERGNTMATEARLVQILDLLRKNGCRITNQRRLLISVILENECSSCKEIYYIAKKKDPTVGIATVYRTVKALEDLNVINRKNMYDINAENFNISKDITAVRVCEHCGHVHEIESGVWYDLLLKQLNYEKSNTGEIKVIVKQVCEHCSTSVSNETKESKMKIS